jgi:isoquinoline 1-oxidoreductase alpha subunit
MASVTLRLNGATREIDVDPAMPLLWALRDLLDLRGTKFGCGVGACGACTVLIGGAATQACQVTVGDLGAREITTIEGLSADGLHPVQQAWLDEQVSQCGYCQAGQIMTAVALLATVPTPTDDDIDDAFEHVLCRCGTYGSIRRAVHRAAR